MFRIVSIICKYAFLNLHNIIEEKDIEFIMDGVNIDECAIMGELFKIIEPHELNKLEWVYILNTDTQYDFNEEYKDQPYCKLYKTVKKSGDLTL